MCHHFSLLLICFTASPWLATSVTFAQTSAPPQGAIYASGADGVLKPWKSCDVACAESGIVKTLSVGLGDHVEVGQPIAELDSENVHLQLAIAESQASASGRVSSAKAEVELHSRKVAAFEAARERQYGSQLELERAQADLAIAEARLIAELEESEVLKLQVARFRQQIEQRRIVAPISGIVVKVLKEVGEYVAPNSPEIVTVVDVSRLRASFYLLETEVNQLPKHGKVMAEVSGHRRVVAMIEHVAPMADPASGLIEVSVLIDNPELNILGSRCTILFDVDTTATAAR